MTAVYHAHSGLRFLILLAAVVAVIVLARGLATGSAYGRAARTTSAIFVGLLHVQFLVGLALVLMGVWYPALIGHLTMMLLAIVAAQLLTGWAKKATDGRRAHSLSLAGVAAALLLILGGIAAIGRTPLESRAPAVASAAG